MSSGVLGDRRKALEESFFSKREAKLREQLQEERSREEGLEALAGECGVQDKKVLAALLHAGIEPETLAALTLIPLVAVAWANGNIEPAECDAVLEAADRSGVRKGEPPFELLEAWLAFRPPDTLLESWVGYANELRTILDEEELKALRDDLVSRALKIAEAAGGIMGLGSRVSRAEKAVLGQIEDAI